MAELIEQQQNIRLTQLSHGAGCACKLGSSELADVLRHLIPVSDPNILVDAANADDAAVYRIDERRAIVATTDFFTPIVDDPYDFGRIAAANAISDIFAMGARPLFALNLVGFPRSLLGRGIIEQIIRGGGEIAREAGIAVVGGHSIDDPEPKFGLCVIGEVDPERVVTNSGAQIGDVLLLTKAIGTGVITTALKKDAVPAESLRAAVASMTTLNRAASEAMLRAGVHAATDVTGYGLMGHLGEVLRASKRSAVLNAGTVPLLPNAEQLVRDGYVAGGTRRNIADTKTVDWNGVSDELMVLLCDAQTSGGLLIALPGDRVDQFLGDVPQAAVIGEIADGETGHIRVRS